MYHSKTESCYLILKMIMVIYEYRFSFIVLKSLQKFVNKAKINSGILIGFLKTVKLF